MASAALSSVQHFASVRLSVIAPSATLSASSAIPSVTSWENIVQSSAGVAISSANASAKTTTSKATATFEVGGESDVAPGCPASTTSTCHPTSTIALRIITAILSTILLLLFLILLYLLFTRCRAHRKSRNQYEAEDLLEVREAREMKLHDVGLLSARQGLEFQKGSSASCYRRERNPIRPITSPMKPLPLPSSEIKGSRAFSSKQQSERRPSSPVSVLLTPFFRDSKRPSSPTTNTHILYPRSTPPQNQKPAPQAMIPNHISDSTTPSQDISFSQFPHPHGGSLTHSHQPQKIFWSFPSAITEPLHPAFASESSTSSFGFQTIPPPLSPASKPPVFPTHANLKAGSIAPPNQPLKPSQNLLALKQKKVLGERELEMKQQSKSDTAKRISVLISEIDALSREQERQRMIEGWLDALGWGEGSVMSAGTGGSREQSVTTVATQEWSGEIDLGGAF